MWYDHSMVETPHYGRCELCGQIVELEWHEDFEGFPELITEWHWGSGDSENPYPDGTCNGSRWCRYSDITADELERHLEEMKNG